ncbi:MAG: cation:proton antiporter [Thermoproteota archaeon]|nr:cation:proton antiporter [Thermoproteota archaeon]
MSSEQAATVGGGAIIQTAVSLGILILAAKMMGELFERLKQPAIVGMLIGGIIVGPYALGSISVFGGAPLVSLTEVVRQFGEIAAIVILFIAGMEMSPKEFAQRAGSSFTVGSLSVIVPFIGGFLLFALYDYPLLETLLAAVAITATSIAITVQVLKNLGKMENDEARLILAAALIDDVIAIAVLSVVMSLVGPDGEGTVSIQASEVIFRILQVLGAFVAIILVAVLVVPRILRSERLWRSEGSKEIVATGIFLIVAGIAASSGLSPITGSFAVGMAVAANNKVKKKIEKYADHMGLFFVPLFFGIIGAQVNLRGINIFVVYFAAIMTAVAIVTKIAGSGLPAILFLKDKAKGMKVGIGMISRGEVGLIVAQVGLSAGAVTRDVYTMVVIMVAATTIITPIWLKRKYKGEEKKNEDR